MNIMQNAAIILLAYLKLFGDVEPYLYPNKDNNIHKSEALKIEGMTNE